MLLKRADRAFYFAMALITVVCITGVVLGGRLESVFASIIPSELWCKGGRTYADQRLEVAIELALRVLRQIASTFAVATTMSFVQGLTRVSVAMIDGLCTSLFRNNVSP